MQRNVAIVGTGQTRYTTTRNEETYEELIFQASKLALDDAGMTADEIDAVVLSIAPEALFGLDHPDGLWGQGLLLISLS